MAWSIKYSIGALKDLKKLDPQVAQRIVRFLGERVGIDDDPRRFGGALEGSRLGKFWKYRIGDYRVYADIQDYIVKVLVVRIGHRREVYKSK